MAAVEVALRTLLVVVFGVAVVSKVRSRAAYAEFAASLGDIKWLTGRRRSAVGMAVPALEAAVAVLLVVPVLSVVAWGFGVGAGLLAVFVAVTTREVSKGRAIRCRCFGAGGGEIGPAQIARNVVLLVLAIGGLALALAPGSHGGVGAPELIVAIGLALIAGLAIVRWDDLASLVSAP